MSNSILFLIYLAGALTFLLLSPRRPYQGSALVKIWPILSLALAALVGVRAPVREWLALALLFSAGGDIALELDRRRYFVLGLGLFLVGHLAYVGAFASAWSPGAATRWLAALTLTIAALYGWRLWPRLGAYRWPVVAYVAAIAAMNIAAAGRAGAPDLVYFGALSFLVSDALIGIDRFLRPIPARDRLIMATYYLGQGLIIAGHILV